MLFIYIGAAVVIGLLTGFVLLSVIVVSRKVTGDIRMRASELLSSYDRIIEKKSREIEELNARLAEAAQADTVKEEIRTEDAVPVREESRTQDTVVKTAERLSNVRYRDMGTADIYRKIRGGFDHSPVDVIQRISVQPHKEGPAALLLRELDYATVCRLSSLPPDKQRSLLEETLDEDGKELLRQYAAGSSGFRAIGFYDFLRAKAQTEPGIMKLRVPPADMGKDHPAGVEVISDDSICEGFQIEADNKIYDYSVRKREIS